MGKINCIIDYTSSTIEYMPGFVYFSYWFHKIISNNEKILLSADPNHSIWVVYKVKDKKKLMEIERLACAQWGECKVHGKRPTISILSSVPKWPKNIFPYE